MPYTTPERGKALYDHVIREQPDDCLELGFAHGVASCYIAAALHELGSGHLTCVDIESSSGNRPNLEDLLARAGLDEFVTIHREKNSYTWFLKKAIEANSVEGQCNLKYDFCFIDGPKNWTIDGMAFFCVDKLLKDKGWVLFDDYRWSYIDYSKSACDGVTIRELSTDQIVTPNIELVFHLLVMQHPSYGNFIIDEDWAWAQKINADEKKLKIIASTSVKYRILKKIGQLKQVISRK